MQLRRAKGASRTLDFLFLHGTQALEMHRRFLPSSPLLSFLLRRPFFAGTSAGTSAALVSMAASRVTMAVWGSDLAGGERARFDR